MFLHRRHNVLKAHRDLVALLSQAVGQAIQHVRRGEVAHDSAAFPPDVVHVPVDQQEDVVDRDVFAALVHDGNTVGVAVHGEAEVVASVAHGAGQQP